VEEKWNLERPGDVCQGCGRTIGAGEEMMSALVFTGVEFERRNWCLACWENVRKEDLYSHWSTKVPEEEEKPKPRAVNLHVVETLFKQLLEEDDPAKEAMTFLLGIILVQKRVLKYREVRSEGEDRYMILGKPKSGKTFRVKDPGLDATELDRMGQDLKRVLEGEEDAFGPAGA